MDVTIEPVEKYDPIRHAVPPNSIDDMLILAPNGFQDSWRMFVQRLRRIDFILVYSVIIIMSALFIVSSTIGLNTSWYQNLKKFDVNPWLIRSLWLVTTLLSYIGLFVLWEHVQPDEISKDLAVSVLYLLATFISFLWSVVFYQMENIQGAFWLAEVLLIYKFWLFIYMWYIKPIAALFLIPVIGMYAYLIFSVVHLAGLNNVVI